MKTESLIMRFFLFVGLDHLAWSLRRLHCPVKRSALVLEVGSGASPYFRSNVLVDAYESTEERFFTPLVNDRPTVIASVEALPFKDNQFDFVIASHVLEHSTNPAKFLSELQRVALAGYIEVPDAFMERLTHYGFHRLEISDNKGELTITKKDSYMPDPYIVHLFANKVKSIFPSIVARHPFQFHVRYYWDKKSKPLKYSIANPEVDCNWDPPVVQSSTGRVSRGYRLTSIQKLKGYCLRISRTILSQHLRNRKLNVLETMLCASCGSTSLRYASSESKIVCNSCHNSLTAYIPH